MSMTHYMELLMSNQPWNLLLFMAIPVILAEMIAITEFSVLLTRNMNGLVHHLSKAACLVAGIYFTGIIVYLVPQVVVPLTLQGAWRGPLDVLAVGAYLVGGVPLILLTLHEARLIDRHVPAPTKLARHVAYIAAFLILAHVAMVAGMLDPSLTKGSPPAVESSLVAAPSSPHGAHVGMEP